ncbi:putative carbonic anhydrase-like protein 1 [Patella vulgata]|uniref:putative carbonic anhydrase-like protein 1 n=1 Tax=Patella vulgata TaxID=6465 RepID=UPI0021801365|nr:putative carbonic anhydrase-like protein 1 [Patella vulgata]
MTDCPKSQWILILILCIVQIVTGNYGLWADWWSYEGISGPEYWGLLYPDWLLCSKGRNQSPVNVDPKTLLFDPSLDHIMFKGNEFTGYLVNNGHDITFDIEELRWKGVNITGGPVSYNYRIKEIRLHFGTDDSYGSEHSINGKSFPAEIHIMAYNSDLYSNITEAEKSPRGMLILAIFAQTTDVTHGEFEILVNAMNKTKYKDSTKVREFYLSRLLPPTDYYITYEGSLTHPGCYETVTWVILNKPIYISKKQIDTMRKLNQAGRKNPQMLMAGNLRPRKDVNQRTIRTNINFHNHKCSMVQHMYYSVNNKYAET